jgi:hypothetical protein
MLRNFFLLKIQLAYIVISILIDVKFVVSVNKENNKHLCTPTISVIMICSCLVITPFQLYGQSSPNQISNSNYLQYENLDHKFSLLVPSNWNR